MAASNTNRWKLGLFVSIGVSLTVGSLMWLGISQLQRRTTPAYFYFAESVNGLEVGATVQFLGVELGRVEEIFPAPDRRHIEVRAGIYVDTLEAWGILSGRQATGDGQIPEVSDDLRGKLVRGALTSVAFIELEHYDKAKYPEAEFTFPIPPETIHTVPSTFKSLEMDLSDALAEWPALISSVVSVLQRMDDGLAAMDFEALNREAVLSLTAAEQMMTRVTASPLVNGDSDLMQELTGTLVELRGLTAQLRGPGGDVDRAVTSFEGAADAFQEDFAGSDIPAAVASIESAGKGFTGNSAELSRLLFDLRASLNELTGTLSSVRQATDILARDPSSLLYGRSPKPPFK